MMNNQKMEQQVMAILPPQNLSSVPPFIYASMDQFGPFSVKNWAQGRRHIPCHVTLYHCLGTKACAFYLGGRIAPDPPQVHLHL